MGWDDHDWGGVSCISFFFFLSFGLAVTSSAARIFFPFDAGGAVVAGWILRCSADVGGEGSLKSVPK
jgi:hypothetical protein